MTDTHKTIGERIAFIRKELGYTQIDFALKFGERLKQIRLSHNVARQEFAKSLGIGLTSLHHYENGDRVPDVEFLVKLDLFYGADINWLLFGETKSWQDNLTADDLRLIEYLKVISPKTKQALLSFLDSLALETLDLDNQPLK